MPSKLPNFWFLCQIGVRENVSTKVKFPSGLNAIKTKGNATSKDSASVTGLNERNYWC